MEEKMHMAVLNTEFVRREPTVVICDSALLLRADYSFIGWPRGATVLITGMDDIKPQLANMRMIFRDTDFMRIHMPESEVYMIARYLSKGEQLVKAVSLAMESSHDE
jgi:hypothetical protein